MKFQIKKWDSILKHVDILIAELHKMHRHAKEVNSPVLVDLNRALEKARKLRKRLIVKHIYFREYKALFSSIVFLIEMAKKIYSLFINCILNKIIKYEVWKDNTTFAYS